MQIRPITDLRNTNEISEICNRTGEPIYITKNGYGDLVVMSLTAYEKTMAEIRLNEKLTEGLRQAKNGEYRSFAEVVAELDAKYVK